MKVLRLLFKGSEKIGNKEKITVEVIDESIADIYKGVATIVITKDEEAPLDQAIKCIKEIYKNEEENLVILHK